MPRNLSDYQSKLFRDEENRETRYINPDGRFTLRGKSGLNTARDISSLNLYTGNGSDNVGRLHRKFYTDFGGQKRKDILHELDTNSLVAKRTNIQAQMILPKTPAPEEKDYGMFSQGDFREGKRKTSMGAVLKTAALTAAAGLYIYRGLKGAGWFPGGSNFFKPLAKIQESNIVRTFYNTKVPWTKGSDLWNINLRNEMKRGVGLSTIPEGIGRLMGRSIEGIPEALTYMGFTKTGKAAKWIPRKILGGSISGGLGFNRGSFGYRRRILRYLKPQGINPIVPSAPRILGRLALFGGAVYAGTLAFNYMDYRARKSKALDKTPLREGFTGMAATAWVKSRMAIQKVLKASRITDLHNYLEDIMPGYLRVAGMAAGVALGIKAGIKPPEKMIARYGAKTAQEMFLKRGSTYLRTALATLPRTLGLGVAGYAAERALSYDPEQLEKIYSGEEKIPVKSGRWWEFGRSPWEGGKTKYYKQHWYPLMMSRYREKGGLYPSEDWKWQNHWLIGRLTGNKVDPYAWEKEYAEKRPYPITTGAFEDVPIIGPSLQATLGRFIKPRKLMHTEAWVGEGGKLVQQPDTSERIRRVPTNAAERLGLKSIPRGGMGEVVSPQSIKNLLGEQQYRFTEWFGLPGFIMQETYKGITGKESAFETARLQSPERATGFERNYWDRELGGLVGTTEIFRRFFPHRRRQVQEYNPIPNLMGKEQPWLPGPEYFIDFKHGDPFTKIQLGEARLPGEGYEALNELHSNIPGVYDAMDRFLILADVAPYSDQFKHYRAIVNMWQKGGVLDEKWTGKKEQALRQREDVMQRYEFTPRRFGRIKDIVEESLTEDNTQKKEGRDYNAIERAIGGAWEATTHTAANVPIPAASWMTSKLLAHRTPIEHYERYQVFGRESAFWNQPVRDFTNVYATEAAGKVLPNRIPADVQKRRELEEYFDRLKYVKYRQLESLSEEKGDPDLAKVFSKKQQETMFGVNPFGSWSNLYRAMPRRERDYFQEFRQADVRERGRIKQLVSKDMARLYEAQWGMEDLKAGREPSTQRAARNTDADLSEFFMNKHLPGPNWIGWHPDINLDKVKLKVVKNEGQDIHDFNLWESQEREMRGEPIPNIENYSSPNPQYDSPELRKLLLETLLNRGVKSPRIEITTQPSNEPAVNMDFDLSYDQSDRYKRAMGRRAYMMA